MKLTTEAWSCKFITCSQNILGNLWWIFRVCKMCDDVLEDVKRAFNFFFRTSSARREKMRLERCTSSAPFAPHLVGRDGSFVA
jgi:hypothetical protein